MGCIFSSDAIADGGILEVPFHGKVYVYVAGFREPTQTDFTELLKGSVSAAMATKFQCLRSQVVAASSGRKIQQRKSQEGKGFFPLVIGQLSSPLLVTIPN